MHSVLHALHTKPNACLPIEVYSVTFTGGIQGCQHV